MKLAGCCAIALLLGGTFLAPGTPAEDSSSAVEDGPYLGQRPPGETPEVFAPVFLSARFPFVARIAFSPDGTECWFTLTDATFSRPQLRFTRRERGVWTAPAPPGFVAGLTVHHEPFFSRDGRRLYFTSDGTAQPPGNARDLWAVGRTAEGWGVPKRLPPPVNSDAAEFFFSQADDGTAYFTSVRPGGLGGFDLYRAREIEGPHPLVENLGAPVNSTAHEFDPCIAPDGSFLVFGSTRPDGRGGMDLYVSFSGRRGWSVPATLGESFNTPADEYAPSLSPDGRFLFFVRHNGERSQLYWVAARVMERLRRK
jgi:hypothetical protein